jgi:hypothetical protein
MLKQLVAVAFCAGAMTISAPLSQPAAAADFSYDCYDECDCRGCASPRGQVVWVAPPPAPRPIYVVPAPVFVERPPIVVVVPQPRRWRGPHWRAGWHEPVWHDRRSHGWHHRGHWRDTRWHGGRHGGWHGGGRRW